MVAREHAVVRQRRPDRVRVCAPASAIIISSHPHLSRETIRYAPGPVTATQHEIQPFPVLRVLRRAEPRERRVCGARACARDGAEEICEEETVRVTRGGVSDSEVGRDRKWRDGAGENLVRPRGWAGGRAVRSASVLSQGREVMIRTYSNRPQQTPARGTYVKRAARARGERRTERTLCFGLVVEVCVE